MTKVLERTKVGSAAVKPSAAADMPMRSPPAGRVQCLDVESFSDADLVPVVCMQGLANRGGPTVFLRLQRRHCHSSFESNPLSADGAARVKADELRAHKSAPEFWIDRYSSHHGYRFETARDPIALLKGLGPAVKGVVRFRLANRCELAIAVTLAGLHDAIAVPDEAALADEYIQRLPVVADIRDRFASRLEATRWAVRELMGFCNPRAVFSQNDTNAQKDPDIFSLDLAVAERMFVFNLDYWEARKPDHFELVREILGRLEPMSPMYGWGTSEAAMMVAMGPSGTYLICTGCPNLSFHKRVPSKARALRTKRRFDASQVRLENVCYVTFMVNEGDTLKWMGSVMGAGRWLEPERGTIPVNWGTSPFITEHYPGLMEYFYETSTENDVFVSSISGYGYYGLKHSMCAMELADREKRLLAQCDIGVGSVYAVHGMLDAVNGRLDGQTDEWLVRRGCRGYMFEAAQQNATWFTSAGQPVLGVDWSLFYWKYRIPGEGEDQLRGVAARIRELAGAPGTASFVPVYGGSPSDFARIAEYLPGDRFKVVGLDEFVAAAALAGQPPRSIAPVSPPPARSFRGRIIEAAQGLPGEARESGACVIDLAAAGVGSMKASVSFGWDEEALHVRVQELAAPASPCESRRQAGYAAGEFDLADGVGLWFDFNLDGTRERGDLCLWLGFSSVARTELWCCMLNDRVLAGVHPPVKALALGAPGRRVISASLAWSEIDRWLELAHHPAPSLRAAVARGFLFGCQPMLVEGLGGRAFLNGRSNRRENETAAVLADDRARSTLPMPDGWDETSLRVRLA